MPELIPNYLSTGIDGSVTALFNGGVQIFADVLKPNQDYSPEHTVRWVKQSNGAVVATNSGAFEAGINHAIMLAVDPVNGLGGTDDAYIDIVSETGGSTINVIASGLLAQIISSGGFSTFAQGPVSTQKLILAAGFWNVALAQVTRSTQGFTITRTGVGRFTFTADDTTIIWTPIAILPLNTQAFVFSTSLPIDGTFAYGLNSSAGAAADINHCIFALGGMT